MTTFPCPLSFSNSFLYLYTTPCLRAFGSLCPYPCLSPSPREKHWSAHMLLALLRSKGAGAMQTPPFIHSFIRLGPPPPIGQPMPPPHCLATFLCFARSMGEVFHNIKAIRDKGTSHHIPHIYMGGQLVSGAEHGVCSPLVRSMDALWGRINKISN